MGFLPAMIPGAAAAGGGWPDDSTPQEYDGVNDSNTASIRIGTTGTSTSHSVWVNPHDMNGSYHSISGAGTFPMIFGLSCVWWQFKKVGSAYQVQLVGLMNLGGGPTEQLLFTTTSTVFAENTDQWFHILVRMDLTSDSGNQVYVDDVDQALTKTTRSNTFPFPFTAGPGHGAAAPSGGNKFEGCMAQLWASNGDTTSLDWDTTANRRKFIDASGNPVNLGSDGSTPTGAAPAIFAPNGNPATNDGNRGNLTLTGAVVDCSGAAL